MLKGDGKIPIIVIDNAQELRGLPDFELIFKGFRSMSENDLARFIFVTSNGSIASNLESSKVLVKH